MPETNSAPRYSTELFCQCENRGAEGGQSVQMSTKRSGKYEYAAYNAGALTKWKGNITGLRIDYFSGGMINGDSLLIHNIMLAKTKDEAKAIGKAMAEKLNEPPIEKGDCNGDRVIDNKDVVLLFNYLSGGSADGLVTEALDYNVDGVVNNKDVTYLFRAVSAS